MTFVFILCICTVHPAARHVHLIYIVTKASHGTNIQIGHWSSYIHSSISVPSKRSKHADTNIHFNVRPSLFSPVPSSSVHIASGGHPARYQNLSNSRLYDEIIKDMLLPSARTSLCCSKKRYLESDKYARKIKLYAVLSGQTCHLTSWRQQRHKGAKHAAAVRPSREQ